MEREPANPTRRPWAPPTLKRLDLSRSTLANPNSGNASDGNGSTPSYT